MNNTIRGLKSANSSNGPWATAVSRAFIVAAICCLAACGPSPGGDGDSSPSPSAEVSAAPDEISSAPATSAGSAPVISLPGGAESVTAGPPDATGDQPAEMLMKARELQMELEQLAGKLRDIQAKAMDLEHVANERQALEDRAIAELGKLSPKAKADWDRMESLAEGLSANEEVQAQDPSQFSAETRAQIEEYQQLSETMGPLQEQVAAMPEIEALRDAFQKTMQEEVQKLDPNFETMETRYAEIMDELRAIQQSLMALQMSTMMPPGTAAPAEAPENTDTAAAEDAFDDTVDVPAVQPEP